MKKFLVFAAFCALTTGVAFAEVRSRPLSLTGAKLERGQFSFSYAIGGGCAEHAPEVSLKLKTTASGFLEYAEVVVRDVASQEDFCEAMLYREGTVDLFQLLKETAAQASSPIKLGNTYRFKLPDLIQTEND